MDKLILVMIFLLTILYIYILYTVFFSKKDQIVHRLKWSTSQQKPEYEGESERHPSIRVQIEEIFGLFSRFTFIKKYFLNRKKRLSQASVMMKPEEFLAISIFVGVCSGIILLLLNPSFIAAILFFIVGFKVPDILLNIIKAKRLKHMNKQLPEALTILANGVRAGYSLIQAMDVASRELEGPIAVEFAKAIHDNSIGKPFEDCMLEISERTDNEDIDLFITALIIQRQVGGNLAEILDTISQTIRERIKLTGEIRTMTTSGKMSAVIISLLPIVLAIVISFMNPEYMSILYKSEIGQLLILGSIIMDVVGILFLKNIVSINI